MQHHMISITKDEAKQLKVKLHPSKYMHYIDFNGSRISEFYASEKQAKFQIQKIKSAFNNFETWEVIYYENVGGTDND